MNVKLELGFLGNNVIEIVEAIKEKFERFKEIILSFVFKIKEMLLKEKTAYILLVTGGSILLFYSISNEEDSKEVQDKSQVIQDVVTTIIDFVVKEFSFLKLSVLCILSGTWILIHLKRGKKLTELEGKDFEHVIFEMKEKELFKFIKSKFRTNKNRSTSYFKDIFNQLVCLEYSSLDYGIARMQHIEGKHDLSIIPYILTLIGFIITYYKLFLDNIAGSSTITASLVVLVYVIFIVIFIARIMDKLKGKTNNALYFRSLLEAAKERKKEMETSAKEKQKEQIEQVKKQQECIKKTQDCIENKQEQIEQRLFFLKKENMQ